MNTWKEIWNKKAEKPSKTLKDFMDVNGFNDTGVTYEAYQDFWRHVNNIFKIKTPLSFYEIGCGAGLSLKILHDDMDHVVGGSDYSKNSIMKANDWMISDDIRYLEAINVPIYPKYDYVVAFSVFHYFKDFEYLEKILDIMLKKSNKGIGIFDVCDEEKKDIYVETRKASDPDYEKRYVGLDHLFIHKNFWNDFAKKNNLQLIIEDQHIDKYKNSKLRYNVYLIK